MSDIRIQREHSLESSEVSELAEDLARDIKGRLGGDYRWEGDHRMHYKHIGVDAVITFDESSVLVEVVLGLLMKGLKGMLETEIHEHLDEHIGR